MAYNELKQHGTDDFPFQLYKVDCNHPQYVMSTHWHSSLEIIRIIEGEFNLSLHVESNVKLFKGDVFIINSEVIHSGQPRHCVYECLVIDLKKLNINNGPYNSFADSLLMRTVALNEQPADESIKNIILKLFSVMSCEDTGYQLTAIGLTLELLGQMQFSHLYSPISKLSIQNQRGVDRIKAILKYISDNCCKDITLDDMADEVGFTPRYFCKFFKKMTNTTPITCLIMYRIEQAAKKLRSTDESITQIAYTCGFNDLSYFIKIFKRMNGVTPSEYRNNCNPITNAPPPRLRNEQAYDRL